MPNALELPRMRTPVIPRVCSRDAVIRELVPDRCPRLATIVGARHHLSEPATALRGVDAVWIRGRALDVVDLPAREVWSGDVPTLSLSVSRENEGALLCADQHPNPAHSILL